MPDEILIPTQPLPQRSSWKKTWTWIFVVVKRIVLSWPLKVVRKIYTIRPRGKKCELKSSTSFLWLSLALPWIQSIFFHGKLYRWIPSMHSLHFSMGNIHFKILNIFGGKRTDRIESRGECRTWSLENEEWLDCRKCEQQHCQWKNERYSLGPKGWIVNLLNKDERFNEQQKMCVFITCKNLWHFEGFQLLLWVSQLAMYPSDV